MSRVKDSSASNEAVTLVSNSQCLALLIHNGNLEIFRVHCLKLQSTSYSVLVFQLERFCVCVCVCVTKSTGGLEGFV
jgi:hypothetical protein